MVKAKVLSKNERRIDIELKDITPAFVNSIRRYSINMVPVYAIDSITVYENTTALFDEYIAHRIGQIPLTTPEKGPKDTEVGVFLDFQGPGVIMSGDLKSNNDEVKPALDNIPILTLKEGQTLRIEGKIKKDIGRHHAKFQSGISSYELSDDEKSAVLFVESLYHMPAEDVLKRAIDEIRKDLSNLKKSLK